MSLSLSLNRLCLAGESGGSGGAGPGQHRDFELIVEVFPVKTELEASCERCALRDAL